MECLGDVAIFILSHALPALKMTLSNRAYDCMMLDPIEALCERINPQRAPLGWRSVMAHCSFSTLRGTTSFALTSDGDPEDITIVTHKRSSTANDDRGLTAKDASS